MAARTAPIGVEEARAHEYMREVGQMARMGKSKAGSSRKKTAKKRKR